MEKPVYFSNHARERMLMRGAEEDEVIYVIASQEWKDARQGSFRARAQFDFNQILTLNNNFYKFKTVEAIFSERYDRIIVVTVKVYYFN